MTRRFDRTLAAAQVQPDELLVVKHGAIWCPPCRHMDTIIDKLVAKGTLPRVRFFEIDIDEEPELAARFHNGAVRSSCSIAAAGRCRSRAGSMVVWSAPCANAT